jgi:carbonyl reductase 1
MTSYSHVGAVTGANKGIGLAIVRQLALQYPSSSYNNGPLLIYLTARNEERGKAALESLKEDAQLKNAKALRSQGGLTDVKYLNLDISSNQSIQDFAALLKTEHPDGIDFLINNAAVAMQGFDSNVVKETLHSNYYGTLQAVQLLLPHIKNGGRLVNVASMSGNLSSSYSNSVKSRFLNAKTPEDITQLMEEFTTAVENGTHQSDWPSAAYAVSKAGVIGFTRVIARQNQESGSKTLINSCCPGYVKTDMTRGGGVKTPDQGAQTPVLLALGNIGNSNAEFWQHEKITSW